MEIPLTQGISRSVLAVRSPAFAHNHPRPIHKPLPPPASIGAGYADSSKSSIERVLREDRALLKQTREEWGFFDKLADPVGAARTYINRMRQIDLDGCHNDFRAAFQDYISAGAETEVIVSANIGFKGLVKSLLTSGLSSFDAYFRADTAQQRITDRCAKMVKSSQRILMP